jgi:heat shock protein HslJ
MKNKQIGFIAPLLLGIIIILLITIGGIFLYKNKTVDQTSLVAPVSTSTANVPQHASSTSKTVSGKSTYEPSLPSQNLTSKTWFWTSTLRPGDHPIYEARDISKFKLTFNKENTFSASTDCNGIGGEYKITGNKITFDKMMSTQMYCEGSQEAEYGKMLAQVVRFEITTDSSPSELLLTLKDGSRMLYKQ